MGTESIILEHVIGLPPDEREKIITAVLGILSEKDERTGQMECPRCGGKHIMRYGYDNKGEPRHRCLDCHRTFVTARNSVLCGSQKDDLTWKKYAECLLEGISIRRSAEICGIHRNTAWRWRNRILDALQDIAERERVKAEVLETGGK